MKFSVLMSLYIKEKDKNFKDCIESILNNTVKPNEIVIIKDGPLNANLDKTLNDYVNKYGKLFKIISLQQNVGLGLALNRGVLECSNNLIARMDTDDICVKNRFELQLNEFKKNKELDILGGQIAEFDGDMTNIISYRNVPLNHEKIVKYQKKRSAFNHMTVMFKKDAVLKAGNYQSALLMEDDLLWSNMLKNNCYSENLNEILVYARTGLEMIERRGGIAYLKKYIKGRKKILNTGFISYFDYIYTILIQTCVAILPKKIRKIVFIKILR